MKTWSFYRLEDGLFISRRFSSTNAEIVEKNTPDGCAAIEGRYDQRTQRVDLATGDVVAHEAPPDARRLRDRAQARIAALEGKQNRPARELALDPSNTEARRRLEAIDAEIMELRKALTLT